MPSNPENLLPLLGRELSLVRDLVHDLVACRKAFIKMDLEEIHTHVAKQAALCEDLRRTRAERAESWQTTFPGAGQSSAEQGLRVGLTDLDPALASRIREVITQLSLAENEIRNLNQVHRCMLAGSKRTLNVLTNALLGLLPTYTLPQAIDPLAYRGAQL